jgi:hypothetical protein
VPLKREEKELEKVLKIFIFIFVFHKERKKIGQTFPQKLRKGEHLEFCQRILSKTKFVNQVYLKL